MKLLMTFLSLIVVGSSASAAPFDGSCHAEDAGIKADIMRFEITGNSWYPNIRYVYSDANNVTITQENIAGAVIGLSTTSIESFGPKTTQSVGSCGPILMTIGFTQQIRISDGETQKEVTLNCQARNMAGCP